MAAEQVFDPNLGEPRDAFPGEVVAPEQEKTLQRLMREAAEGFRTRYAPIVDELTPQQQEAIAAAELRLSELKRLEYLEAIRQNPAIIIQGVLKECNPAENNIAMAMLFGLNEKVERLERNITSIKTSNQLSEANKTTLAYMKEFTQGRSQLNELSRLDFYQDYITVDSGRGNGERPQTDKNRDQIVFEIIKKLGLVPSDSLRSFDNLYDAVSNSGNTPESGKPYAQKSGVPGNLNLKVANLTSNRPGLEGITASFNINNRGLASVIISSSPEALARIIDRGQYVPYQKPTEQPIQLPAVAVQEEDLSQASVQPDSGRSRRFRLPLLNRRDNKQGPA